jgi:ATP-dependent Clp protease protease subunit
VKKFWNFTQERDARRLRLEGEISQETWLGDEVTPAAFRAELFAGSGDLVVAVNSPGGDVFAAAQIYDMLMEYPGKVTVYIDGLAASAASVIAMAGEEVVISPVSCIMIHNPSTLAIGDGEEMLRAKAMLDEVKESIINAYEIRTGLSRVKLGHLMDAETWMNARKAVELGFADRVGSPVEFAEAEPEPMIFSRAAVTNSLLSKIPKQKPVPEGTSITAAYERLNLFNGGNDHVKTA